ncbi:9021_t:CDS:1, partial [Scutellospora calospora]
MSGIDRFFHICYTSYHCYECKERYKCKHRLKEFTQEERERLHKEKNIPSCKLCGEVHFRCKGKKCKECCKRNACDSYPCKSCLESGIDCKYTIIQSKKEFKKFKKFDLTAYTAQLEYTEKKKVHVQGYCQFSKRKTRKNIVDMFNDNTIWIPDKKMRGDSVENRFYAMKEYDPCIKHKKKGCKCHHGDNLCQVCDDKCPERKKSRIEGLKDLIGPFNFGILKYRKGENSNNTHDKNEEFNENDNEECSEEE